MASSQQGEQADVGEALRPERPEPVAQLPAHRTHRRLADRSQACLARQALDVAIGQATHVRPDHERFQWPGPDDALRVGDDLRDEAHEGAPDLGHGHGDLALRGLDVPRPMAIARARGVGRSLVAQAPEEGRHLVLDRPLEDQLGAQPTDGGQGVGIAKAAGEHRFDGGLDLGAGGYSLVHGVGLLMRFATSASEPTPSSIFQRAQDATARTPRAARY
jgi:hypothetical protein